MPATCLRYVRDVVDLRWLGTGLAITAPPPPSALFLGGTSSNATVLNKFVDVARDESYEFPEFHEGESPRFEVVI